MYYYMLKVLDMYSAGYDLIIITKITGTDNNNNNLTLSYVNTDSSEYGSNGSGIFNNSGPQWQTNRSQGFPHYIVFSSPSIIKNLFITTSNQGYTPKDCEIYFSKTNLSSFTDSSWLKISSFTLPNSYTTTTNNITPKYFMIKDGVNLDITDKTSLITKGITPETTIIFTSSTMVSLKDINASVISFINNQKYNIEMLK